MEQEIVPKTRYKKRGNGAKIAIFVVGLALIVGAYFLGVYVGGVQNGDPDKSIFEGQQVFNQQEGQPADVDFSLFWEVYETINAKHIDRPFDKQQLIYGAIAGMVDAIGDPFTAFMDPEETEQFAKEIDGTFEGIGAEIGIKNEQLVIVAPLENSPAKAAGLRSGDVIVKIDDQFTDGLTILEAVQLIRGPRGTEVTLTIVRNEDFTSPQEITIVRDVIELKSVETELLDNSLVLVEISRFSEDTISEFNHAIDFIQANNAKGLIIDLRDNPGGFLDVSIDVTSQFIESGVIVTEDFIDQEDNVFEASGEARLTEIPVVILVNEGSASASEIMAGALQDHKRATVIGTQTFGKGSVQELEALKDGSSLRITIASWITPNGRNINKEGLVPDIEVELTEDDFNNDRDPQLDRAKEYLQGLIR
jgi:carboxyl-terminal processing protease